MKGKCCPFCGTGPEGLGTGPLNDPGYDSARVAVGCQTCGCRGPSAPDKESAVVYWNQRSKWGCDSQSAHHDASSQPTYDSTATSEERMAACIQFELDRHGNAMAAAKAVMRDIQLGYIQP